MAEPKLIFKDSSYQQEPFLVMRHYIDQQCDHLTRLYKDVDPEEIRKTVTAIAKERFKDPTVKRVSFPSPGNHVKEIVNTTTHLKNIEGNITSPSGNTYCQPSVKPSLISITIRENVGARDEFKAQMFAAEQAGDFHVYKIFFDLQTAKKISNNSTPGANQSLYNIIADKSGFNAITSTTRLGVQTAYGTCERYLAGNIYLPSAEDALSYIYSTIAAMPVDAEAIMHKYQNGVRLVDREEFTRWMFENIQWYSYKVHFETPVRKAIAGLTPAEMTYIYYTGSIYNLFNYNKEYFRNFIDELFRRDIAVDPSIKPTDIFKLEGTMSIAVRGSNPDCFGVDENGELYNLKDAIKNNPDGVCKMVAYGRHMENCLQEHADLLSLFLRTRSETPQPHANKHMVRKATVLCDTDSNLFTTNDIVRLYHGLPEGKTDYSPRSLDINSIVVYMLSRMLEHTFARYSSRTGLVGKLNGILMKNEFLYPIFIRTGIPKTYGGLCTYQEGNKLRIPKMDIKGLPFVASTKSKLSTAGVKQMFIKICNNIIKTSGNISAEEILRDVADVETEVLRSLNDGEDKHLSTVGIKELNSYSDGGERVGFYYRLWEDVFADEFNMHVDLPNKFVKVYISGEDKLWSNTMVIEEFKRDYPETFDRFVKFRLAHPDKKVNYLIAPVGIGSIPVMFRKWLDKRRVITDVCSSYYLLMNGLNLNLATPKKDTIVLDFLAGRDLDL